MNETAREALDMPAAGGTSYYAEDGWVFREFPGKGIECIGRYEDLKGGLRLDGGIKAPGHHESQRAR
jgi:hypothetical protein